ncbi:hypothetical protein ACHHYP_02768 [Achlya hypogyna]|uniref:Uncharacterized protein n=1 Tax=Achlya hypogyna TaxID=1202772 RepID=A0A1V9Z5V6_ACHHY|nr:hypothetical protein ACHHYP_02768 [Achlya hypogyna]
MSSSSWAEQQKVYQGGPWLPPPPPPVPPSHLAPYRGKCKYKSGRCTNERTLKENGEPHTLCEPHRLQHNKNQRKSDVKRRRLKKQQAAPPMRLDPATVPWRPPVTERAAVHPISFEAAPVPALYSHARRNSGSSDSTGSSPPPATLNFARNRLPPHVEKLENRRTIESTLLPPLYSSIPYPHGDRWALPTMTPGTKLDPSQLGEPKPPAPPHPDEWSHEDLVILTEMVGLQSSATSSGTSSAGHRKT